MHKLTDLKLVLALLFATLFFLFGARYANAQNATVTVQATMPVSNCDGSPVLEIESAELYVDASPIPYPDGYDCTVAPTEPTPPPPSGFTPVEIQAAPGDVVQWSLQLTPGITYYIRARACTAGGCSILTPEISKTISLPVPNEPIVIILN